MRRWLLIAAVVLISFIVGLIFLVTMYRRDRHPDYSLDLAIHGSEPAPLLIGFAAVPITPQIEDTWTDANGDSRFAEEDGDSYNDLNGNGEFDAFWIAGFSTGRAANGVHDDLWARVMVIDDSTSRLAIVALDAIGFFHDSVIDVRKRVTESIDVDYIVIASTHVHEAPDLMGLWGPSRFLSGVNPAYEEYVTEQTTRAVVKAVGSLRPAVLRVARDLEGASALVMDSRLPTVLDPGLRILQAVDRDSGETVGTLVAWANHPETTWSRNLLISSDFPHYVRDGIENGVITEHGVLAEGLGGIAVYLNGAIGGLMTTSPEFGIQDPGSGETLKEPSFEKARAQGQQLALLVLKALGQKTGDPGISSAGVRPTDPSAKPSTGIEVWEISEAALSVRARTLEIDLANPLFRLGAVLGIINRGFSGWMKIKTELAAWTLGDLSFVAIPGEIYPEIIEGGIEKAPGQDFDIDPVEIPSIRSRMPGRVKFVLGMANDEIGYIIPKSEWDEEAPYLYDAKESPYGEINSTGPDIAPLIHREVLALLADLD